MFRGGDQLEFFLMAGDGIKNLLRLVGRDEGVIEAVAEKNGAVNHACSARWLNGRREKSHAQVNAQCTSPGGEWGQVANDGRQMFG